MGISRAGIAYPLRFTSMELPELPELPERPEIPSPFM